MKKIFGLFVLVCVFATASSAWLLGDSAVLMEPVSRGEFEVDVQTCYSVGSEILSIQGIDESAEGSWLSLSDAGLDSITYLSIPVRLTYGLLDDFSVRLTLPYASLNVQPESGDATSGSGLANIELEGILKVTGNEDASLSALTRVKFGSGKKFSDLSANEAYVGSRSTDVTIAGIAGKKLGPATGRVLCGYLLTNPYKESVGGITPDADVNITDQLIYSVALFYPMSDQLELSGELWGASSLDKEKVSVEMGGISSEIEYKNSARSSLYFSPSLSYEVAKNFSLIGEADILLSKTAAVTMNLFDMYKGTTYTFGGTFIL